LSAQSFDFVYEHISSQLYLASIAGGTDIISCFVLGNPSAPVYRGEIACPGLGMAVEVWDENGKAVNQEKGELVCVEAFPSMPLSFWNDKGDKKYKAAYFERYDNIWAQGDFAETTAADGLIIHGRSDATLNPGGVRIGTAEIYRQVEQFAEVSESVAIGQQWEGDVRIVLFLVLAEKVEMSAELDKAIRNQIRAGATPRHVPAVIVIVADIPRTKSGKIAELAVRDVVEGKEVDNSEALANPESLSLFKDLDILR
jgi:acetoacetyl-CoA synthetase